MLHRRAGPTPKEHVLLLPDSQPRRAPSKISPYMNLLTFKIVCLIIMILIALYTIRLYALFRYMPWLERNFYVTSCPDTSPQFTKFIWMVTDGFGMRYAAKSIEFFNDTGNAQLFTIRVPGPKFSHAIYTSFMTGMPAYNYIGTRVTGDSLLQSYSRSRRDCQGLLLDSPLIRYTGPEWSFLEISGMSPSYDQGQSCNIVDAPDMVRMEVSSYVAYRDLDVRKEEVFSSILKEGQSLIVHSGAFDKRNHYTVSLPDRKQILDDMSAPINDLLISLKEFVDKNPDYVLLLNSDHGVDSGGKIHGRGINGNIGYLQVYSSRLPGISETTEMDVVDFAPTVATLLGIDIPMRSIGYTRLRLGKDEDLVSIRKNLLQLQKAAPLYFVSPTLPALLDTLLSSGSFDEIEAEVSRLKQSMFSGDMKFSIIPLTIGIAVAIWLQYFVIKRLRLSTTRIVQLVPVFMGQYIYFAFLYSELRVIYGYSGVLQILSIICIVGSSYTVSTTLFNYFGQYVLTVVLVTIMRVLSRYCYSGDHLYQLIGWCLYIKFVYDSRAESSHSLKPLLFGTVVLTLSTLYYATRSVSSFYYLGFHFIAVLLYVFICFSPRTLLCNITPSTNLIPYVSLLQFLCNGDPISVLFGLLTLHLKLPEVNLYEELFILSFMTQLPTLWVAFANGSSPGMEVDPSFGGVGVESWNTYPVLSAIQMIVGKYGIGLVVAYYTGLTIPRVNQGLSLMLLQIVVCSISFYLVLYFYNPRMLLEDAATMFIFLLLTFMFFFIGSVYRKAIPMSRF